MVSGINPNQKIDVIDLTKNFANDRKLTRKDLSNYIQTLIGTKPLNTKDKKALASFVKNSKRVGKRDVYIPDHIANSSRVELNNLDERKTVVNNITDLIQNAILIDISKNTKKNSKPNVDNYLRFYIPVKINNDIFTVRIVAENNSSKNLFNILNADIYDVIIDKKMPTSVHIPANTQSNIMKPTSNNIITNNSQNINPNQITIREMLNGVKDSDGKTYYQEEKNLLMTHNAKSDVQQDNFSRPKTLEELHEDVRQRAKGREYLGYFTQYHLYKINSHKFKNVFKFMTVHFRLFYFKLID